MYDRVTGAYSNLQHYVNDEHAKRECATIFDSCKDKPMVNDIDVFRVGEFNVQTGELTACKEFIATAKECLEYGKA